jgi:hypothetical protein
VVTVEVKVVSVRVPIEEGVMVGIVRLKPELLSPVRVGPERVAERVGVAGLRGAAVAGD